MSISLPFKILVSLKIILLMLSDVRKTLTLFSKPDEPLPIGLHLTQVS